MEARQGVNTSKATAGSKKQPSQPPLTKQTSNLSKQSAPQEAAGWGDVFGKIEETKVAAPEAPKE